MRARYWWCLGCARQEVAVSESSRGAASRLPLASRASLHARGTTPLPTPPRLFQLTIPPLATPATRPAAVPIAQELQELGFGIMGTYNTAAFLRKAGLKNVQTILKVQEGRPNAGACSRWAGHAVWGGGSFECGSCCCCCCHRDQRRCLRRPFLCTLCSLLLTTHFPYLPPPLPPAPCLQRTC